MKKYEERSDKVWKVWKRERWAATGLEEALELCRRLSEHKESLDGKHSPQIDHNDSN